MSCGGASAEQKSLGTQETALAQTMRDSFNSRFAGQTAILDKLNKAYTAQFNSPDTTFNRDRQLAEARAIDQTAGNYENAARAVNGQLAGRGGDSGILSGVDAQIHGAIASDAAKNLSNQETNIDLTYDELGRQRQQAALAGMQTLSSQYDPQNYAQLTSNQLGKAYDTQKSIDSQKGGFWKTLGGIGSFAASFIPGVGPAVSHGISALTKGIGLGGKVAGAASGDYLRGYSAGDSSWQPGSDE